MSNNLTFSNLDEVTIDLREKIKDKKEKNKKHFRKILQDFMQKHPFNINIFTEQE